MHPTTASYLVSAHLADLGAQAAGQHLLAEAKAGAPAGEGIVAKARVALARLAAVIHPAPAAAH